MKAVVTICSRDYHLLLPYWLARIRRVTSLPIFVVTPKGNSIDAEMDCEFLEASTDGNPFPIDRADHACAEKLRIFDHVPRRVSEVLFLDLDVMVLDDFWSMASYFERSRSAFIACPDLFVGYKERMEEEFRPFDPSFRMKYLPDGCHHYFNTGVFFASRDLHSGMFKECLRTWVSYIRTVGRYPSIFDQNLINYCLIAFNVPVEAMPVQNNCLRQYGAVVDGCGVLLNGMNVNAMHFNGGEAPLKLSRWLDFESRLGPGR
jgi:hypothetical protein